MVSPEMSAMLRESYSKLQTYSLDVNAYDDWQQDVVFDMTTIDTYLAGLASRLLSGQAITREEKTMLLYPFLVDEVWNGHWVRQTDLSGIPEILRYAQVIEQTRASCLKCAGG